MTGLTRKPAFWLAYVVVALVALAVAARLFPRAIPIVHLDVTMSRAQAIAAVCDGHGTSLPAAALAFPGAHPAVASVCVGARSPKQITRNLRLASTPVPAGLWADLKDQGLLRVDAPVPE